MKKILSEQKYKNKNRIYYHGKVKDFDEDKSKFEEFYLSTRKEYAFKYAKRDGIIEAYCLKNEANIFNMKCSSDEAAFRKFCQVNYPKGLSFIDNMKSDDWCSLAVGGDKTKEALVRIIKVLNYDGFFNYEIDKIGLDFLHKIGNYSFTASDIKSPSIAIFNKNILQKVNEEKIEDCIDKDKEIEKIKDEYFAALLIHPDFDKNIFIKNMFNATFSLSKDDIISIINNFSDKEKEENLRKKIAYRESLLKRFGHRSEND